MMSGLPELVGAGDGEGVSAIVSAPVHVISCTVRPALAPHPRIVVERVAIPCGLVSKRVCCLDSHSNYATTVGLLCEGFNGCFSSSYTFSLSLFIAPSLFSLSLSLLVSIYFFHSLSYSVPYSTFIKSPDSLEDISSILSHSYSSLLFIYKYLPLFKFIFLSLSLYIFHPLLTYTTA